ncbi:Sodium- and chloride-dependent neutral and basic amino acid transporter [Lucilia cuprina]|nr:Sodium- and chloride-dependent neutral and basic amino acid transporter [Lucilia cuprina]
MLHSIPCLRRQTIRQQCVKKTKKKKKENMIYESSYESGRIPFVPNGNRGHWSKISDFIFAGLGLSYRMDIFLLYIQLSDKVSVTSLLPAFIISLALYTVPLLMVQSFMGQFSSSGFISAFRISPIFKGIGYVSLALNVLVLIFYSLFAMIPLVYLIGSFKPQLPWSCDGTYNWVDFCNTKPTSNETDDYLDFQNFFQVPSNSYFQSLFSEFHIFGLKLTLSFQLIMSAICIWIIIAVVSQKCRKICQIGQLIRYSVCIVIVLLILLIVRLSFIPGVGEVFSDIFTPNWPDFIDGIKSIPNYGISAFGPGWGLILTLASFNKFNTNIRYTILTHESFHGGTTPYLALYLTGGSVFDSLQWGNLWSIMFYFMLVLAGVTLMIIQLNIILYSIFDEFITLKKNKFTMGFIFAMAVFSLYFSTEHGYENFLFLRFDTLVTQSLIDLLVILAVLWVYGRKRFQRDLEFMINERFATWKVFALRFLAPIVLLIALTEGLLVSFIHSIYGRTSITIFNLLLRPLPWLCVPGYVIYCLVKAKGPFTGRLLKSARPTDWYPVAVEDLRYSAMSNQIYMARLYRFLHLCKNHSRSYYINFIENGNSLIPEKSENTLVTIYFWIIIEEKLVVIHSKSNQVVRCEPIFTFSIPKSLRQKQVKNHLLSLVTCFRWSENFISPRNVYDLFGLILILFVVTHGMTHLYPVKYFQILAMNIIGYLMFNKELVSVITVVDFGRNSNSKYTFIHIGFCYCCCLFVVITNLSDVNSRTQIQKKNEYNPKLEMSFKIVQNKKAFSFSDLNVEFFLQNGEKEMKQKQNWKKYCLFD